MTTTIQDAIPELMEALGQTLWMSSWAFVLTIIFGLASGVLLRLTSPDGLTPNKIVYGGFGALVNLGRSLPFLILLIALIPVTRLIVGSAIGPTAAIVPLTVGAVPFYARVVESALREVDPGKIEAAIVMGSDTKAIVRKVLIPESMPGLVSGATLTLVTLIGYSTMAGVIGGGGVGDFAIRYGYQRFDAAITLVAVVILIIIVQAVQTAGDAIVRGMNHKR
ncbi:methionine ABC transporter permease [Dermatophilus congolensis]|uniref:Methionine import system permease protein MetP n=1 Tax=Dermatophilus congolensis TaxID=1863 RepID=A0A239V6H2_9MICO|nr:methionine ABC transporter permease [Dermatophilus congolensis]MBO3130283.1 ABC transporter permease [Dermatophilus congolensis]MBO3131086.1 ABC transporter permease [Dermatophilus congolensis]MBO3134754.1 ABC transporter permease [Dermatophilus congolensis]MBO3136990.1 ABC transporter permease [Dermatophilus congolensis]MBO3139235.1 ABC transporter permease [Dermatophilus congolensis]